MRRFGPQVTAALECAGHIPTIYPSPFDTWNPTAGIRQAPEGPRYSTGFGDFIGVPTVLVENHMLKPYRQRALGTYVLLEAALRMAAMDAERRRGKGGRPHQSAGADAHALAAGHRTARLGRRFQRRRIRNLPLARDGPDGTALDGQTGDLAHADHRAGADRDGDAARRGGCRRSRRRLSTGCACTASASRRSQPRSR